MNVTSKALVIAVASACLTTQALQPVFAEASSQKRSIQTSRAVFDAYILGPGDQLLIEVLDIPELSGQFSIGPDGTIYLPRLRALYVEGLTIEELRYFLNEQFKTYVKNPEVYVRPIGFRAVRVYVGGEISRPGYYVLSGNQVLEQDTLLQPNALGVRPNSSSRKLEDILNPATPNELKQSKAFSTNLWSWPKLFDALRAAQGVTPFSNLSQVQVTRKQPLSAGGGKIQADVNFLKLVTSGDESVNIRLFDGDFISVSRSPQVMRDQLLATSRTNISPDFVGVFVSGRVKQPGPQNLPQGATLNQAIASAGGPKLLRGGVEFLRFNPDGSTDRRQFSYNASAGTDDYKNPVLMSGDVIRVNESLISAGVEVLNEFTGPAVGIYSVYSLFKP